MFSNSGVDAVSVGDSLFGSMNSATEKVAAQPKTIHSHDVSEQEVMDFILGEESSNDMDFLNPLASLEDSSSQEFWAKKENNLGPEAPDRLGLESFVQTKMNKYDSKKESELLSGFSSKRSRSIKDDSSSAKHVKFDSSSKDCPPSINNNDFLQRSPKRGAATGRKNNVLQSSKTSQFHPSTVNSNYNRNSILANNSHLMIRPQQKTSREEIIKQVTEFKQQNDDLQSIIFGGVLRTGEIPTASFLTSYFTKACDDLSKKSNNSAQIMMHR
jgi:hypothetical protein